MDYKKPQSTLVQGGMGIYPLTTADQVILADGSRLEKDGRISADSAANSAKLGGKAPEYYLQPRNLLDNSDFRNPVNQRGITYGANRNNGYTIDRWYYEQSAGAGDGYFGLTEYYVSLLAPSDGYSQMYQNLEKYAKLKGKNVTFAARVNRGNVEKTVCVTFTLGSIAVGLKLFEDGSLKLYSIDGMNILIRATGAEEFQFIWAALYEGSYTADTLPPYVPKGYAAELAECKKQVAVFGRDSGDEKFVAGYGSIISTTSANIYIPYPTKMRVNPTISDTSGSNWILRSNGKTYSPKSISPWFSSEYVIGIRVAGAFSSEDVGKTAILNSDTSTKVVFSSEM